MADKKNDNVNHPQHYISANGLETIDVIEAWTEGLEGIEAVCTANVIKYISRWKKKNGVEDLEKARWYLDKLINRSLDQQDMEAIEAYCKNDVIITEELMRKNLAENASDKVDKVIRGIIDTYFCFQQMAKINGTDYTEGFQKEVADMAYASGGAPILNSHYLSLEDLYCSQYYPEIPEHILNMWDQFTAGECWLVFRDCEAWDYMVEQFVDCGHGLKPFPNVWHGDREGIVLKARWSPLEIGYNNNFIFNEFMVTCHNGELVWAIPEYNWMHSNRAEDGKPIYYVGIQSFCDIYPAVILPATHPTDEITDEYGNEAMYTIDACTDEVTAKEFVYGKTVWVATGARGVDELVHYLGCGYISRTHGPSRWPNRKPLCEWSPFQYNKNGLRSCETLCYWVEEEGNHKILHWGIPPKDYQKLDTIGGKPFVILITSED